MLMLGRHKGESFESATEADPQYYFWGASQSKPGVFLKVYLEWVNIQYTAEPTERVLTKRSSGEPVSFPHLRAHETSEHLVCRPLPEQTHPT